MKKAIILLGLISAFFISCASKPTARERQIALDEKYGQTTTADTPNAK